MKEQRFYCIGIHKRCNVKEKAYFSDSIKYLYDTDEDGYTIQYRKETIYKLNNSSSR